MKKYLSKTLDFFCNPITQAVAIAISMAIFWSIAFVGYVESLGRIQVSLYEMQEEADSLK